MSESYDLAKIRALLLEVFSDEEMRCFCYDEVDFKPVYDCLKSGMRQPEVVRRLVKFAEEKGLFEKLLALTKARDSTIYKKHQPYFAPIKKAQKVPSVQPKTREETLITEQNQQQLTSPVDFVIITALEEERNAVLNKLPKYQRIMPSDDDIRVYFSSNLPVVFPDGSTGTYHIIVMPLLNMGRVEATTATTDAIRRWNPRYIILVGIAGGVTANGVQLGDILVSSQIVDYELQKLTVTDPQIRWEVHRADPRLLGAARNFIGEEWQGLMTVSRPLGGKPKRHIGPIASGDKVIAYEEGLAKYYQTWSKLIGVEMEAAGVATASFQAARSPGFFMIRSVSDLADEKKGSAEVERWRLYACDVAASYTIGLLKSGPVMLSSAGEHPLTDEQFFAIPMEESQSAVNLITTPTDIYDHTQEVRIFLGYAREDAKKIEILYQKLSQAGFSPWMDTKDILPGERWKSRIKEAIQNSHFFLACLSKNSIKQEGYLQEEIKHALDLWQEYIYLIPIRLENCQPPESLRHLHWLDLFMDDGWERLFEAIQIQLERRRKITASISNLEIESPYGTMRPDSKFYIERATDHDCWEQLNRTYSMTLFIQAPRQMGKSSLMRRMLDKVETKLEKQSAFIDFQTFPERYFKDEESFLIEFCTTISEKVGIPEAIDQYWQGRRTNIRKCSRYLSEYIIPKINAPFILAIDEIERLATSPFRTDFFGMLRTWHNERAYDENFAKMTLFFSSAIEPYLLIDNPYQSPFNVASLFLLQDFTLAEVEELNLRHQSPLNQNQVKDLMALVGGHPFLIRLAFYHLVAGTISLNNLLNQATEDTGLFSTHLRHLLLRVVEKPDLKQTIVRICRGLSCEEDRILYELKGLGLIKRVGQQVVFRNELYKRYFEDRLNE